MTKDSICCIVVLLFFTFGLKSCSSDNKLESEIESIPDTFPHSGAQIVYYLEDEIPIWVVEILRDDINSKTTKVFVAVWEGKKIFHVYSMADSCVFCKIYFANHEPVDNTIEVMSAEFLQFTNNSNNWSYIKLK